MMYINHQFTRLLTLTIIAATAPLAGMKTNTVTDSASGVAIDADNAAALSSQPGGSSSSMSIKTMEKTEAAGEKELQKADTIAKVKKEWDGEIVIVMPNEEVLKKIFSRNNLDHFAANTKICRRLAGEHFAGGIEMAIRDSIWDYYTYLENTDDRVSTASKTLKLVNNVVEKMLGNNSIAKAALQEFRVMLRRAGQ